MDNKYCYELLGGAKRFGSYTDYFALHNREAERVETRFKTLWNEHAILVAKSYGIVLVASLVLFYGHYWVFIGPFIVVQFLALLYMRFWKKQDSGFWGVLILGILLPKQEK